MSSDIEIWYPYKCICGYKTRKLLSYTGHKGRCKLLKCCRNLIGDGIHRPYDVYKTRGDLSNRIKSFSNTYKLKKEKKLMEFYNYRDEIINLFLQGLSSKDVKKYIENKYNFHIYIKDRTM